MPIAFGSGATVGLNGGPNGDGCPAAWCHPHMEPEANGYCGFWGAPPNHAWRPEDMETLLKLHEEHGVQYTRPGYHSGYNEVIVDGISWNAHLPNTIEAFFELEGDDAGVEKLNYARDAHRRFLTEFGLSVEEVPLLKFDPARWHAPFRAGTADPMRLVTSSVQNINKRFGRHPYSAWPANGALAWSGVLLHCFDGYEDHGQPWQPNHAEISSSLIFNDQEISGKSIPVFSCSHGGIILRPGFTTRVICGNGGDSGGSCHDFCPRVSAIGDVTSYNYPGDGCGGSWRPADFGMYLQRTTMWQKRNARSFYNEVIIEGAIRDSTWLANLPTTVEAFFQVQGEAMGTVERHHAAFVQSFDIRASDVPLLTLDLSDWDRPFRDAQS